MKTEFAVVIESSQPIDPERFRRVIRLGVTDAIRANISGKMPEVGVLPIAQMPPIPEKETAPKGSGGVAAATLGSGGAVAFAAALAACLFVGCASVTTDQSRELADGSKVTTKVTARTLFDAHADLAKLRATGTDKTQGVTIAGLEESASASNAVQTLKLVIEGAALAKP